VTDASCVGIVVIGRNEGERLIDCLKSVQGVGCPLVYVDSGSVDGSAKRAQEFCETVVELDPRRAFSAARARNEGFAALMHAHPEIAFVQFVDGDCTLLPGWLERACEAVDADGARAVVIGRLVELRPEASIYNHLCALEWQSPDGELGNSGMLGGIMFVRTSVFARLNGFNENVIAGEDSEFAVRVAGAGFKVTKISAKMATHDADIRRFGQWWRRAVRSGHAIAQRFSLSTPGVARDCARERRSVLVWGIALPLAILLLAPFTYGASLLLAAGYLVLDRRIQRYRLAQGDSRSDARLYARFVVLGKFAEAIGLIRFHINNFAGRFRIIEYK